MTREYLKKATLTSTSGASEVHDTVKGILDDIETGGDAKALEYAAKFDRYEGAVLLSQEEIDAAIAQVPEKLKADIRFAHDNVRRFAEIQRRFAEIQQRTPFCGVICGGYYRAVDQNIRSMRRDSDSQSDRAQTGGHDDPTFVTSAP